MNGDAKDDGHVQEEEPSERQRALKEHVLAVRMGHGANCSSIGSVIDTLFVSAVVTSAVFAAVCAAMATEEVTIVGRPTQPKGDGENARVEDDPHASREP